MIADGRMFVVNANSDDSDEVVFIATGPTGPEGIKPGYAYSPSFGYVPVLNVANAASDVTTTAEDMDSATEVT